MIQALQANGRLLQRISAPNNSGAGYELARLLAVTNHTEAARDELQRILVDEPKKLR